MYATTAFFQFRLNHNSGQWAVGSGQKTETKAAENSQRGNAILFIAFCFAFFSAHCLLSTAHCFLPLTPTPLLVIAPVDSVTKLPPAAGWG